MGLRHSSVVAAGLDEVFAWHTRPGAVIRLTPPWLPVRVVREAASVRDGRAVLALPGGLRWVAAHQPDSYDPPNRFADALESLPLPWRHVHEFARAGDQLTLVTDAVDTPLPARALRPMFAYRHRQLAGDLAAHAMARAVCPDPLTVAVTGVRRPDRHRAHRAADNRRAPGHTAGTTAAAGPGGAPLAARGSGS